VSRPDQHKLAALTIFAGIFIPFLQSFTH
jgi:hypothetical protein